MKKVNLPVLRSLGVVGVFVVVLILSSELLGELLDGVENIVEAPGEVAKDVTLTAGDVAVGVAEGAKDIAVDVAQLPVKVITKTQEDDDILEQDVQTNSEQNVQSGSGLIQDDCQAPVNSGEDFVVKQQEDGDFDEIQGSGDDFTLVEDNYSGLDLE
jgi:hypothetical protein